MVKNHTKKWIICIFFLQKSHVFIFKQCCEMRLFGIIFKHCKKNPMLLLPKNLKKKSQIFYQGGLANHKRVATYKMFQLHFTKIHDFVISNARKQQRKSHSKIAIGYCALLPYQWNLWSFHSVWKILQKLLILARKFKYHFSF